MQTRKDVLGTVYLICMKKGLDRKIPGRARHYIGWTEGAVEERVERHRRGAGAKILKAAIEAGDTFRVVRTWGNVDRHFERRLKNMKSAPKLCPCCNPKALNWAK